MRKQSAARKFLVIISLIAFLGAGYLTVSAVTSQSAWAQMNMSCVPGTCVPPAPGVGTAFAVISGIVVGQIAAITGTISAFFAATMAQFSEQITDKVMNPLDGVIANITGTIKTIWKFNLLPSLQGMTQQFSTINADQTRALASFTEAANLVRAVRETREQEVDSHRGLRVGENVCVAGTVTGGMTRAAGFQRAYGAAAPAEQSGRSGNAAGTAGAAGGAAETNVRFQEYVTRYCNRNDNNGAAGCTANGTFAGQDIDVAGTIFAKDTIDVRNAEIKKTVDDLVKNIAEPFVRDPVPPGAVNSASGQEAILAGEAYRAKRQTVYDALYNIVSRRIPGSNMGEFVRPLRIEAGINPAQISPNPSHNEIMQAMMSERFRSGRYTQQMIDEPENSQREMVIQQAFQLMQMSDQMDLMDRYSLLLAAQAGAEVRKAKHPGTAAEGAPLR